MNGSELISGESCKGYYLAQEDTLDKPINTLPIEVLRHVLSFLDTTDIQNTAKANRLWRLISIDIKHGEFLTLIKFVNFLGNNFHEGPYAIQSKMFFDLASNTKVLKFLSLAQVITSISKLKEDVLNILKDIENEELNNLKNLSDGRYESEFIESIFKDIELFKEIDKQMALSMNKAMSKKDKSENTEILYNFSRSLIKSDYIWKALEVANVISKEWKKGSIIYHINKTLMKSDNLDRAIEFAKAMSEGYAKGEALRDICWVLSKRGCIERAISVASLITVDVPKGDAYIIIINALMRIDGIDNIEKALELTNIKFDDHKHMKRWKYARLTDISITLFQKDNIEKAMEVINTITDQHERVAAITRIAVEMDQMHDFRDERGYIKRVNYMDKIKKIREIADRMILKEKLNEATIQDVKNVFELYFGIRIGGSSYCIGKESLN